MEYIFPSTVNGSQVWNLIGPLLFGVLSTLDTGISFFNFRSGSRCFFANSSFMKFPWAPLSISAFVATILFPSIILASTCIDFSFSSMLLTLIGLMKIGLEDLDVATSLLTKNPACWVLLVLLRHLLLLR